MYLRLNITFYYRKLVGYWIIFQAIVYMAGGNINNILP